MNEPQHRISREIAPEVFQLAAELYTQKQQEYSLQELIMIGEEAQIPAEFIQQAVELIKAKQKNQEIQINKKTNRFKLAVLGVAATFITLIVGGWAYKQLSASNSSLKSPVAILPSENDSKVSGNVERYLMNKEGLVDGLLLSNGKQIKVPPHMSQQVVNAIKPGDAVDVVGKLGNSSVYGQQIEARTIMNNVTKAFVAKQPKQKKAKIPKPNDFINFRINEPVRHWLVNDKGEIRSAILTSGTQVHFAKPLAKSLNKVAKTGSQIKAEGVGRKTAHGSVLEVITLQIDGNLLPDANSI
ncbi:hypothetical protein CI593_04465 [Fischerella thermalis CCMEE 5194]|nr:hypothetical protein CI593_04465 [Fischerella thermalis CCMEE 5194]